MQSPTEPALQPDWQTGVDGSPTDAVRWLERAQRFSVMRAHISIFAMGTVLLLTLNLLAGSPNIWADRWISAWGLVVIIHAIVAGIASLALQLMAEDDIRPASEVRWEPPHSWPPRDTPPAWPQAPADQTGQAPDPPETDPWQTPPPPPRDEERVSWQAASDAAWLANSDHIPDSGAAEPDPSPGDDH